MKRSFIFLLTITFLILSCTTKKETLETESLNKIELPTDSLSELRVLMYTMEAQMHVLKNDIKNKKTIDSSYFKNYQDLFTAQASEHVKRDSMFTHFGNDFLNQYNSLTKNSTPLGIIDQYNAVVISCVSCHQTFCPGPIMRIEKLKLKQQKFQN